MKNLAAFIAYRHTGEDEEVLTDLLAGVRDSLDEIGVNAYCTFFDEEDFRSKKMNAQQIMNHAFEVIDSKDFLFVVQANDAKSEGMLMEVGFCVARGKPIVVATQDQVQGTYLPEMANVAFRYSSVNDLGEKIKSLDLSNLG